MTERGAAAARPRRARRGTTVAVHARRLQVQPGRGATGGRGGRGGGAGSAGPVRPAFDINGVEPKKSPDGKLEALVNNYNVAIREAGKTRGHAPQHRRLRRRLLRSRLDRLVAGLEEDRRLQGEARLSPLRALRPVVARRSAAAEALDAAVRQAGRRARRRDSRSSSTSTRKKQIVVDNALFPNAYDVTPLEWRKDSRAVTFEYNQRGHQVYRVIEIDALTATPRAVISEEPKTFFCYSGKKFRLDVADGKEVIWMSERDGWNHLYLYDGATGRREEPDHQGRLGRARRRAGRRGEAADLVQRERHVSGQGPVLRPLLPHQLRRHRA